MKNEKFSYIDSQGFSHEIELSEKDFELVQRNTIITDQKIQSKPTTFFKDALRRFRKNKSSVAGAVILGTLLLFTIVLPFAIPYEVDASQAHPAETYLAPKLFDAGTGWWDGGKDYKDVVLDIDWDKYEEDGTIIGKPTDHDLNLVMGGQDGIRYSPLEYTDAVNTYAHGGYARLNGSYRQGALNPELRSWNGANFDFNTYEKNYVVKIETINPSVGELSPFWNYGGQANYDVRLSWSDMLGTQNYSYTFVSGISEFGAITLNLNDYIDELREVIAEDPFRHYYDDEGIEHVDYLLDGALSKPSFAIVLNNADHGAAVNNVVVKEFSFASSDPAEKEDLDGMSLIDANKSLSIPRVDEKGQEQKYYWSTLNGSVNLFHAKIVRGTFRIDTYEEKYGIVLRNNIKVNDIREWANRGWLSADFSITETFPACKNKAELTEAATKFVSSITILDELHCPMVIDAEHPISASGVVAGDTRAVEISVHIVQWKYLYPGTDAAPRYLFGTDINGHDMVKLVFTGLRTSLLLGVLVFLVNFSIGLVYGAIAGYFGGWTDILMERFTDILGGVPWIVVMTLFIIIMGNNFWVFALALCMTGWIGTSSLTRTQFYRFKSREYILAARTLGASDGRLIFRHILPNAVGTIVTSAVLMIPSVIFSEATLAYLNLGLQGIQSFGVILSDNQAQIQNNPHLILFPSAVMALIMISFNLFGNGLRDAFNPSLKGGE